MSTLLLKKMRDRVKAHFLLIFICQSSSVLGMRDPTTIQKIGGPLKYIGCETYLLDN
jgi:hypothetical protein